MTYSLIVSRRGVSLLAGLICAMVLHACSGGGEGSTGPGPVAPPITPPPPTKVSITLSVAGDGSGRVMGTSDGVAVLDCAATGGTCTVSLEVGKTLALSASPSSNNAFQAWGGSCSGSTVSCTLTVSAAATVTAAFRKFQPGVARLSLTTIDGTGSSGAVITLTGVECDSVTVGADAVLARSDAGRITILGLPIGAQAARVWLRDLPSYPQATFKVEEVSKAVSFELRSAAELGAVRVTLSP